MLTTTRAVDAQGFGAKTRELDGGKGRGAAVEEIRALWADLTNRALEAAQASARVDHRSHEAQRAEAAEAAQEAEKAERSLNPIGKRQRVHEATERAAEARSRVEMLPEAPAPMMAPRGPHRRAGRPENARNENAGPQSVPESRRGRTCCGRPRRIPSGAWPHRADRGEAVTAFRDMQRDGVRAFVRNKLTAATELAARFFMDRLEALGLVQVNHHHKQMDRGRRTPTGRRLLRPCGMIRRRVPPWRGRLSQQNGISLRCMTC